MRQVIAILVAPVPDVHVLRVESTTRPGLGYYLLIVPPSAWRPHAVRVDSSLRYPVRDGARIRYLSETEVADAYRRRFAAAASQRERLELVHSEALERLDASERLWLTMSLVPDVAGNVRLDRSALNRFQELASRYNGGFAAHVFGGFEVATGLRRAIVQTGPHAALSTHAHVELHTDGAVLGATALWELQPIESPLAAQYIPRDGGSHRTPWIEDEHLVQDVIALLRLGIDHAVGLCGVSGDVAVRASVDGYERGDSHYKYPAGLMHRRRFGFAESRSPMRVARPSISLHTINAPACFGSVTETLIASRLILMDLFQAFGVAEVEQLREDGALRRPYFSSWVQPDLTPWAEQNGVKLVDSSVEQEQNIGR